MTLINLVNNDLDRIPHLLGHHKTIKTVQIEGNPLKTIRRPIIEKGADAILKHLRDKFVEGKDDVIEDWALEMEKDNASYAASDYMYNKNNYAYQSDQYMRGGRQSNP